MSGRELVVLGTGSRAPTRVRNVNGYALRWDGRTALIDPGEGTQQQLHRARVSTHEITDIFISHLHGDHCLGLPGVLEQLALVGHEEIRVHYPASGRTIVEHLCDASLGARSIAVHDPIDVRPGTMATVDTTLPLRVRAARLQHPVDTVGYRFDEPARRHLSPELLERAGIRGPMVGALIAGGATEIDGRRLTYESLSERRPGSAIATLLDTARCDEALDLAHHADLLLCEATFLEAEREIARDHGHLTARQAGELAHDAGVRLLVLTHYSSRYLDLEGHRREVAATFGNAICAEDLQVIPIPTHAGWQGHPTPDPLPASH